MTRSDLLPPFPDAARERVLSALRDDVPFKLAAERGGLTKGQLRAWMRSDALLAADVEQALADGQRDAEPRPPEPNREAESRHLINIGLDAVERLLRSQDERIRFAAGTYLITNADVIARRVAQNAASESAEAKMARRDAEVVKLVGGRQRKVASLPSRAHAWRDEPPEDEGT